MSESEVAAALLSHALDRFLGKDHQSEQARAERQLLELVDQLAATEAAKPVWNEHLTAAVFQTIADDHGDLYATAISNGERNRLNRLIGSRVKAAAGAEVKFDGDKPAVAQLPRSCGALIRRYTLLVRGRVS